MKYKGTLIVVKDCKRALKFYSDMFGFKLLHDNDGNIVAWIGVDGKRRFAAVSYG